MGPPTFALVGFVEVNDIVCDPRFTEKVQVFEAEPYNPVAPFCVAVTLHVPTARNVTVPPEIVQKAVLAPGTV